MSVLEVERRLGCVPRSSNTPLWSLIPAETGGLSWLGEVNRLVCVTESQVATVLLDGGCVYSSCYPWGCCALGATMSLPFVGLRGGWGRRRAKLNINLNGFQCPATWLGQDGVSASEKSLSYPFGGPPEWCSGDTHPTSRAWGKPPAGSPCGHLEHPESLG